MSVFHCPLCPLIFEYRSEVEFHLRREHRCGAKEEVPLAAEVASGNRDLSWARLRALQSSRAGISVTILMATTPGPVMSNLDIARLRRLAHLARRRLVFESDEANPDLDVRLARAMVAAETYPTQEGLAILVNSEELAIFPLPFEPLDRVIIDPTFATRDLHATLQYYPRYRVLALGPRPRLLEGRGLHLAETEADTHEVDNLTPPAAPTWGGKRSVRPERWTLGRARRNVGVELADRLLSGHAELHGDLPLVIAGDGRWRSDFRRQSRHAQSVIGEIAGTRTKDPAAVLARLAQPHLDARLQEEQATATAELARADSHAAVAWGLQAAWAGIHDGSVDLIWVEHGFARPGRPTNGSTSVEVVANPETPGVIDDLVDDLIESAIRNGIAVHLLRPGTIGRPEPIAVRKRPNIQTNRTAIEFAEAV